MMRAKVIIGITIIFVLFILIYYLILDQKCVKERCEDIQHPPIKHETIPAHQELRPYYDFFSKHMSVHLVDVPEKPEWTDPAWTETQCKCVVYAVSFYDRWKQR